MLELSFVHILYLVLIAIFLVTMMFKKSIVVPCVLASYSLHM